MIFSIIIYVLLAHITYVKTRQVIFACIIIIFTIKFIYTAELNRGCVTFEK